MAVYSYGNSKRGILSLLLTLLCVLMLLGIFCFFVQRRLEKRCLESMLYSADTAEDLAPLLDDGKPTVIIFGADYCPTCGEYKPILARFYARYGDKVTIRYVDVTANPDIRRVYNIDWVPSTLFFDREGNPYLPDESISLQDKAFLLPERNYVSNTLTPNLGESLGLNPYFEFGTDETGAICYCKHADIMTYGQLAEIAKILLK